MTFGLFFRRLWQQHFVFRFGKFNRHLTRTVWMLLIALAGSSCTQLSDCVNVVLTEVVSPDGQFIATVFERDCGATTAKNTQVSLRQRSESFNYEKQPSFLIFEGSGKVLLTWLSETKLLVHLPLDAKMFRQERNQKGISFDYTQ
jgi:hypothetical protein